VAAYFVVAAGVGAGLGAGEEGGLLGAEGEGCGGYVLGRGGVGAGGDCLSVGSSEGLVSRALLFRVEKKEGLTDGGMDGWM
jgi:hypothetical protein